jgi:hypothetical protein
MSNELENATDKPSEQSVVMPSLDELRRYAKSMLEETNEVELARAIRRGDRIDSYQAYIDWLRAGSNGELFVTQALETFLHDLIIHENKAQLAAVIKRAASYLS